MYKNLIAATSTSIKLLTVKVKTKEIINLTVIRTEEIERIDFDGNYYVANTPNDAVTAYRKYLTRKSYWLSEYKFVD